MSEENKLNGAPSGDVIEHSDRADATDAPKQVNFQIQRLYVKEQSCKLYNAPALFKDEWKPEISLEMNVKPEAVDKGIFEVNLNMTATAKLNQRTAFIAEVVQSGIFKFEGADDKQKNYLLQAYCPNVLFPYARKVFSDLTVAAGLPPLTLVPMNFEQMLQQQEAKAQSGADTASAHTSGPVEVDAVN